MNVFFSLRGYVKQILGTQMVWGNMTRKGVQGAGKAAASTSVAEAKAHKEKGGEADA